MSIKDLNCGELTLQAGDIDALERAVKGSALPHCDGGFFYGQQFQDEQATEYQSYDLEFCAWARAEIEQGPLFIPAGGSATGWGA